MLCRRMKFLKLYLVGYFVLLVGAGLALWQAGVLDEISGIWLAIGDHRRGRAWHHARGGVRAARRHDNARRNGLSLQPRP